MTLTEQVQSAMPLVERVQSGVKQMIKVSDEAILRREIDIRLLPLAGYLREASEHLSKQAETFESERALYCLGDARKILEKLLF